MKLLKYIIALTFLSASLYAQLDRSVPPKPAPAPEIKFGEYHKFELANGLKVFVVENHETPVVTLSLIVHLDPVLEKENAGYIDAAGQLMRTGTKTRTKAQLDEEIDFIGASLSTGSGSMYGSALKKHADKLFELFSDVAINAEFRQEELDKLKTQTLSALAAAKDDPGEIASRIRQKLYYGEGHPYSEFATEQTVNNFTLDMCKEFYKKSFIPNISYLAIVGDITKEEAEQLAKKYLSSWTKGEAMKYTYPQPAPPKETVVALVDRKNSVQSTLSVGYPVDLKVGSKDAIKSSVANTILGGGVFRLFQNLRETHSYTYGAYSSLSSDRLAGRFTAYADVRNEVTDSALTQIFYEMKRMRDEAVPSDELTKAKNYMSGSFALSLENAQTVANFAINEERFNLPSDYYENYLKYIEEVTASDLQEVSKKYILPENSYIVVVGKAEDVADKLKPFGKIQYYDIYGNLYDPSAASVPAGVTAKDILDGYINAIGGAENIKKVYDRTTVLTGMIQGMQLKMTISQKVPNKYLQEVSIAGMTTKLIVNGNKGVQIMPNGTQPLDSVMLEMLSIEADLQSALKLDSLGITATLKGLVNEDGKQLYELEFISRSGAKWYEYYDPQTKLKTKQTRVMKTAMGEIETVSYLDDYREVAGVLSPYKLTQKIGPQTISVEAESIQVNTGLPESLFVIPDTK